MSNVVPRVLMGVAVFSLAAGLYRNAGQYHPPAYEAVSPMVVPVDPDAEAVAYCREREAVAERTLQKSTRPNYADLGEPAERFPAACNSWLQDRYMRAEYEVVSHGLPADPAAREVVHVRLSDTYSAAGAYLSRHPGISAQNGWAALPSPDDVMANPKPHRLDPKR